MKLAKLLLSFLIFLVSSCNNNKYEEYKPDILDSDKIINCYTNNLYGDNPAFMGNILISQNGIIKAFQVNFENPKWYKVISYEYLNTHPYYKAGNQYFQNCINLKVENEFGLIDKYQWVCFNN